MELMAVAGEDIEKPLEEVPRKADIGVRDPPNVGCRGDEDACEMTSGGEGCTKGAAGTSEGAGASECPGASERPGCKGTSIFIFFIFF
jgi:hypothetical protein